MSDTRVVAYVALGSNLGDPRGQVESGLAELDRVPDTRVRGRSRLYRNPAMGDATQPEFVNAVAALETGLPPRNLLDALLGIEAAHGRDRDADRWAPRTLDLDLILYGDRIIDEPGLKVPHPGLTTRAFVLYPLAELAPALSVPGSGDLQDLLERVSATDLVVMEN